MYLYVIQQYSSGTRYIKIMNSEVLSIATTNSAVVGLQQYY